LAFITLLPKLQPAFYAKDYRPISLVHSFAKLVTKILANRLADKLHEMVSTKKFAFIKVCFIQDNFMLVQQTAQFLHQQKQLLFLFKLDISKAFNSVSWAFLIEVMKKMGFSTICYDMVSGLVATSSTRILLNGVPRDIIVHQRGLRQGAPCRRFSLFLLQPMGMLLGSFGWSVATNGNVAACATTGDEVFQTMVVCLLL
jgi:hypothetical protein